MGTPDALDTTASPQTALAETAEQHQDKKRNKVRSAWISFVGRILAQLIGAAATIGLGLIVVDRYSSLDDQRHAQVAETPAVARERSSLPALAVLPAQDYSNTTDNGGVAHAVTEALVAAMAQSSQVRVLSRTSAMAYKTTGKSLPAIAKELGADWIVETSIVRHGSRLRLTSQLIDGRTDEHVFARVYDADATNLLAAQSTLAADAARDLNAALAKPLAVTSLRAGR